MDVVWFKRDLRVTDHGPLTAAATGSGCIALYVYEDEILSSAEYDGSHHVFLNQCLKELADQLQQRGVPLLTLSGKLPEIFEELYQCVPFERLLSHEETGLHVTYERDKRVAAWCRSRQVTWHEFPQNGVVRGLKDRDGWSRRWQKRMGEPVLVAPNVLPRGHTSLQSLGILGESPLGIATSTKTAVQVGGESEAVRCLDSFLTERGRHYSKEMSSPVTAWDSCSRLSTHLAFGTVSVRQVFQRVQEAQEYYRQHREEKGWLTSLSAFSGRLRWHCHFMQKFEDEPASEFENINRGFDGLRTAFNDDWYRAWQDGQTGYPMVDACMRALHQTGWINFRMRAMLVSFASYHLWLHWREPARYLARHFLDFEPGIHFSQFQMQAGTTGINAVRIYSPIKQVIDQDPEGLFIKRYVPELQHVPGAFLAEPHKMTPIDQTAAKCKIGSDYPRPVVDHGEAYKKARTAIYEWKRKAEVKALSQQVYEKHGSRKRPSATKKKAAPKARPS